MLNGTITQPHNVKLPGTLLRPRNYGVSVVQDNRNISHILAYGENEGARSHSSFQNNPAE